VRNRLQTRGANDQCKAPEAFRKSIVLCNDVTTGYGGDGK